MQQPFMQQPIRYGLAATLIAFAVAGATTSARADDWCGYTTHDNAMIECGYTTMTSCESAVDKDGKGGTCFVDPDTALNIKRATPIDATKLRNALKRETGRG
jgi:hypothetical protein